MGLHIQAEAGALVLVTDEDALVAVIAAGDQVAAGVGAAGDGEIIILIVAGAVIASCQSVLMVGLAIWAATPAGRLMPELAYSVWSVFRYWEASMTSHFFGRVWIPYLAATEKRAGPFLPRFVVMMITPLPARDP